MRAPTTYSTSGSDEIEIVLGAAYTGTQDFEDIDVFRIIDDEGYGVGTFDAFQGDGEAGQWFPNISQPAYDNGAGLYAPEGKASFGAMPDWTEESYNLSEIVTASFCLPTVDNWGSVVWYFLTSTAMKPWMWSLVRRILRKPRITRVGFGSSSL